MSKPTIIHGARAKVFATIGGKATLIGIWSSFSANFTFDVAPSYALGRYSPAALTTTGVSPVSINAGGFRPVDKGIFGIGVIPKYSELLKQEGITLEVHDRGTDKFIARITDCFPTSASFNVSNRSLMEQTFSFIGMMQVDEANPNDAEPSSSAQDASATPDLLG